jgi:hypothetical protein
MENDFVGLPATDASTGWEASRLKMYK